MTVEEAGLGLARGLGGGTCCGIRIADLPHVRCHWQLQLNSRSGEGGGKKEVNTY